MFENLDPLSPSHFWYTLYQSREPHTLNPELETLNPKHCIPKPYQSLPLWESMGDGKRVVQKDTLNPNP